MKKEFDVVVGFVGHTNVENLAEIKHLIENIDGLNLIFFKTSSKKLYIREGGGR
jgi:hypothetical protein